MIRFILIFLIVWLPVQSVTVLASGHSLHVNNAMSTHDADCESHNPLVSDDADIDIDCTDCHCVACHLSFIKFLASKPLLVDLNMTLHYRRVNVNLPASVVSVVPEPIPLAFNPAD